MSRTDWLLVLQGVGITVQMLNASLASLTHNASLALILGALFGGFQFVVQRIGNNSVPDQPRSNYTPSQPPGITVPAESPAQVQPEAAVKPSGTPKV